MLASSFLTFLNTGVSILIPFFSACFCKGGCDGAGQVELIRRAVSEGLTEGGVVTSPAWEPATATGPGQLR